MQEKMKDPEFTNGPKLFLLPSFFFLQHSFYFRLRFLYFVNWDFYINFVSQQLSSSYKSLIFSSSY